MKLVFFGAGTFGLPTLSALADSSHKIVGVVTSADKPVGRGLKMAEAPVKTLARERDLPLLPLADVNAPEAMAELKRLSADVFVAVSFGQIFSEAFIALPPRGVVNVHASLLPKYRGAAPVAYSLLNGDKETGVTTMKIARRLDAGDILLQEKTPVAPEDDAHTLTERLARIGGPCAVRTLDLMERGALHPVAQEESRATSAPKLSRQDAWIDWARPAEEVHNRVRAFAIWPGSKTLCDGRELAVIRTAFDASEHRAAAPGTVVDAAHARGIRVATGKGDLFLMEVQVQGKKPVLSKDFLNGYRLKDGFVFGGKI